MVCRCRKSGQSESISVCRPENAMVVALRRPVAAGVGPAVAAVGVACVAKMFRVAAGRVLCIAAVVIKG